MNNIYRGCRFPPQIISRAVWYYHRFQLSFRDIEDLLAERGIIVSYEAIRLWCAKFGPDFANNLRTRRDKLGDTWFMDEVMVKIRGQRHWLYTVTIATRTTDARDHTNTHDGTSGRCVDSSLLGKRNDFLRPIVKYTICFDSAVT